jgi:hypothetical protein
MNDCSNSNYGDGMYYDSDRHTICVAVRVSVLTDLLPATVDRISPGVVGDLEAPIFVLREGWGLRAVGCSATSTQLAISETVVKSGKVTPSEMSTAS